MSDIIIEGTYRVVGEAVDVVNDIAEGGFSAGGCLIFAITMCAALAGIYACVAFYLE